MAVFIGGALGVLVGLVLAYAMCAFIAADLWFMRDVFEWSQADRAMVLMIGLVAGLLGSMPAAWIAADWRRS